MITRDKKRQIVEDLVEKLKQSTSVLLVDFETMTVDDAITLRRAFKEKGVQYKVAKNTLIKRALQEVENFPFPDEVLKGQTGVAFGIEDPVAPGKVLKEIFDKLEKPKFKAAIVDGRLFESNQLKELAAIPSREDMIASIIGSISAPASGIVGAINAVMRDLVSVIEEVAKKQNQAA